jgi:hypothetical protein
MGCYIGSFTHLDLEALIGPFQTSPVSIIPKVGRPNKHRVIQKFSFPLQVSPHSPQLSINSLVNSNDFPCTWGTFETVCAIIQNLPPGSQATTWDIAEAYHTIPLLPSQWPATVVRTDDDSFYVNTCTSFGMGPSMGAYGHIVDAGADLFHAVGIGPLTKWVDIIYFSVFYDAISMITTVITALCTTYCVISPVVRLAVVFGSKVTPSMMDTLKLSAKTASFQYMICHPSQFAHQKTCSTIAILKTSICYPPCLGYPGSYLKTFTSIFKSFSLVCSGTSLVSPSGWEMPRKLNIWLLLWNCPLSKCMFFSISSNYMGSCYMPVSSSLLDEHILPHWRPCSAPPVHVHSCHITPFVTSMMISPGGQNNFPDQSSKEPSPNLALSGFELLI